MLQITKEYDEKYATLFLDGNLPDLLPAPQMEDTSGNSHYLTDAWFEQDNFISGYTDTIEIPEDMRGLPTMGGSGAVRELLQAAAQSGELENLLRQYSAAGTWAEMALLEDMLYAWANTSGFYKSLEERCAGCNVLQKNVPDNDLESWNRMLHILEAFNGSYFFTNLPGGANGLAPFNPNPAPWQFGRLPISSIKSGRLLGQKLLMTTYIVNKWSLNSIGY